MRRSPRSSPRARQRTYKQSFGSGLDRLSGPAGKNLLAKWAGLESLEIRQLLSSAFPSNLHNSSQTVTALVHDSGVQGDDDHGVEPIVPAQDTQARVYNFGNQTFIHPTACACPLCMGQVAPGDEAAFGAALQALPAGGGATVAGGTTTGIDTSTVVLGNKTPSGQTPLNADYRANTEFMAGDVWVNIVLLNSNGQTDAKTEANWTAAQIASVKTEVIEAMNWWEATFHQQNPNSKSDLNFFVDFTYTDNPVSTKVEPINHTYSQNTLWVDDFLTSVGANSASSSITDMQKYNDAQRKAHHTDWAYTVFIANSLNDTDGKFTDNYFAYTYFGGPYATLTYDNGAWGINRMGQVLAHETGHIFYALDEYSGGNSYTMTSGYYGTQNLNAYDGNPNPGSRQASIMAEAGLQDVAYPNHTSAPSTMQMLGWRDSDSDGVFDVLDVPLTLTGSGSYNSSTGVYTFSGTSAVGTLPNQNTYGPRLAVTTNTVDYIQYRLNGGDWVNANYYGAYSSSVSAAVTGVAGLNTVDFRTIDSSTGIASNTISSTFTVGGATAGFTVTPVSGLTTTEAGATASFTVRLNSQPTGNVTIPVSSSNTAEGTVSVSSLTFTAANWNTAQTVTVTGVDDSVVDGNKAYSIVLGAATSSDSAYNGLNPADVAVTNTDNDTAGFTVTPVSGLTTTEAGGTASFTVKLTSQPTANVTIAIASSNTAEGTTNVSSLTFTAANWNTAQTVIVTGVDDSIADGSKAYTIALNPASSSDTVYNGLNPADVSVTNTDNDSAGFTVTPTSGLTTTEAGGTASFTVKLTSQPTANVTIAIASSNAAEGTTSVSSLTFTAANWNTAQTVIVTGIDDSIADGSKAYAVTLNAATSSDTVYNGLNPADVSVTNTDNDTAGFTVTPTSGLVTTEAGGAASFTVKLTSQPTANVTIPVASSSTAEGTTNVSSLTFTPQNWNTAQTVTVTGADDSVVDGSKAYTIVLGAATSSDSGYNGLNPADVAVTNTDNDTPGVTVTPTSGLTTTEAGGTASFTVRLNSQPISNVVIGMASTNIAEGTTNVSSLTFTPQNWNTAQTVTVTGVDDSIADGSKAYSIILGAAVSSDSVYNGLDAADVSVTNQDNDAAGFTVTPTSGLVTTEAGATAAFTVKLNSQPTSNVTVAVASSNTAEGTTSVSSLTFTPQNWNTPQSVTVTGMDDITADGDKAYTIVLSAATSGDSGYNGLNPADVSVTNQDNDAAGFTVTPVSGLTTSEAGATAVFTVKLNSQPTSNVTVAVASSNAAEGTTNVSSLTFTPQNWNTAQTVTVTGVDDAVADGSKAYTILLSPATSSDLAYNGLNPADVSVTNTDNDAAGFTVTPVSGLTTSEAGATASFTVKLNSQPTGNVTVDVASSNTAEGTTNVSSLTFTPQNWSTAQTVTITGVDDVTADGNKAYTIVLSPATSSDSAYNGLNSADVSVTNTDNDTGGFTVTPVSGLTTTEAGAAAAFTVKLNSQPTGNVAVAVASSNTAEGTTSVSSLTFTPQNWNTAQTVTVTGIDDAAVDGNKAYTIVLSPATSSDSAYNGLNPADVSVTNQDDDTAGFTVVPSSGLVTTESGGTASFTVRLNSQPTANVTIGVASSDLSEGTTDVSSLTFTPQNWNTAQTVTVTGVNDNIVDGAQNYTIALAAATSSDSAYNGLNPADVSVTNQDNDAAGFTVTPTSGLTTTEAGGTAVFTIRLNAAPTGNVIIGVLSSNTAEGTASISSLTFTPQNWNTAKTVTVTGVDDSVADGDKAYSIVLGAAVSSDPAFSGLNPADVSVTNQDNDAAGFTVVPTSNLETSETGGAAAFSVKLNSQPTGNVTIGVASSNTNEGTTNVSSLTFTPQNWNTAQTVTVTGADDSIADGAQSYSIVLGAASSSDPAYNGLNPADVSVTNQDNDSAGITVVPTSNLVTTEAGGTATFSVKLNSQPTGNVTIGIVSSNTNEGTTNVSSLTFTPQNWNTAQTVTVTGADDNLSDGSQNYTIVLGAATSSDPAYNGLNPADVSVTNQDNDAAGITVTPTSNLVTTEAGGTATFSVKLNSQPTGNVTIGVASSNTNEGTTNVSSLTFTPQNWNTAQTVTITGVNDSIADGAKSYTIELGPAASSDSIYNGLNVADVNVTNQDNDAAGVTVTPTSGLATTEAGGAASFTVRLNSQPVSTVYIAMASSNAAEGTPNVSTLVFSPQTWNTAQTVTVTGADDSIADGNKGYEIVVGAAVSSDPTYSGFDAADVSLTNQDDDSAGITVTPTSSLVTTEAGASAAFTVRLNSQPTGNVTIGVASSNTAEGTTNVSSLTFTPQNWDVAQAVTVTGADDAIADGSRGYTINLGSASSSDPAYNGLDAADVALTNQDDDSAGFTVSPTTGLLTTEAGASAVFTVRLNSQPTGNVTIPITASNTAEGTTSVSSLTFTPQNWSVAQTVTVTGVDDTVADGSQNNTIVLGNASSSDSAYDGLDPADVSVVNQDNDAAGFTVLPVSGLTTTEAGGTATFSVKLNSQPTGNVTIGVVSSNTAEGTASVSALTFTPQNWNTAKTVTVTGRADNVDDDDTAYAVVLAPAVSSDSFYAGLNPDDVTLTNRNLDVAGITVTPTDGLTTSESGDVAMFNVVLDTKPTANVTVSVYSDNANEGTTDVSSLTFTPQNWNVAQTVRAQGADEGIADGDQTYHVILAPAVSSDTRYQQLDADDVTLVNADNDPTGVRVTPTTGLVTTEAGSSTTFSVSLLSQPLADVTIDLASSNTFEGVVDKSHLVFTALNWNIPQTVTATGVGDNLVDGNTGYYVQFANTVSADANYNGLAISDVTLTNIDTTLPQSGGNPEQAAAAVVVTPVSHTTTEAGGTATFTLRLAAAPTGNVYIRFNSDNRNAGRPNVTGVTFTKYNWNIDQTVTVTGRDNAVASGDTSYRIVFQAVKSNDKAYNGMLIAPINMVNLDNDVAGIVVTTTSPLVTSNKGGKTKYSIGLASQPTDTVVINVDSTDPTTGKTSVSRLVFTARNWRTAKTVTVSGVRNKKLDHEVKFKVHNSAAVSLDPTYNGMIVGDLDITNIDAYAAQRVLLTGGGAPAPVSIYTAESSSALSRILQATKISNASIVSSAGEEPTGGAVVRWLNSVNQPIKLSWVSSDAA
ncbi:MAG: hypothetical protein K8S99_00530 [Planctomycetes bacterium]|nr:hypothetical protein [Planctomycetota bacterium]